MTGWTVQTGPVGGTLKSYDMVADMNFLKRLSGLGFFSAHLPSLEGEDAPAKNEVARLVWQLGESTERTFFEGVVRHVREPENGGRIVKGFSLEGLLWLHKTGGIRTYKGRTPFSIIQGGGSPDDLLTDMEGNSVMSYGSASLPNVVDASNPGVSMDFRAGPGALLTNIQRLCLQSQYNNTASPTDLRFGLDLLARLEGANNSTPRFYLVRRREASPAPGEEFVIGSSIAKARRGSESGAEAVQVVGAGAGQSQVTSGIVGSGDEEMVATDKTVLGTQNAAGFTNAHVMATRLLDLHKADTEVITAMVPGHDYESDLGDSVTIGQPQTADVNLRLFALSYKLRQRMFALTLGRPRALRAEAWMRINAMTEGHAQSPQLVSPSAVDDGTGVTSGREVLADGDSLTPLTLSFTENSMDPEIHEGLHFHIQLAVDDNAGTPSTIDGTFDIQLELPAASGYVWQQRIQTTLNVDGTGIQEMPLFVPSAFLLGQGVTATQTSATLRLVNRSGADRGVSATMFGYAVS